MEFFNNLFWNTSFEGDYLDLTIRFLAFLAIWALLLYLIYLVTAKFIKYDFTREVQLKLSFLWSLAIFVFLFNIYLFYLIRFQGTELFQWNEANFYLGFAPQLLLFLGSIIFFVLRYQDYKRQLKF